jgi:uncharacterized membrane protein
MADDAFDHENIVVVSFADDAKAYEALTDVKELDTQSQIDLHGAAIVVRHPDGTLAVRDEIGGPNMGGTATGGIIGLLVGILLGPFGVLIGGATGLLIGSLYDLEDEDETESVLSDISRSARVGHTTLLAEVDEPSPDVINAAMSRLDGEVLRRPLADVEAEIAASEAAQRAAKKEARKVLREQRKSKRKAEIHAAIEALKEKLHHRSPTSAGV